ncbi:hypothetical protein Mal64_25760 [Pseudobythopirellula maris]|uniref:DUF721 domain-containing protein n=1 Tax=Pseudobythopirellula maris TaxID=2527991 RepID=A0A5C5ZNJ7_9BACT|nr:DciA family protein [Pseudobythopirellula maris]TWT89084.1 hypothetical protein Mal64_25760 [Pseudobythopirellula maris]
MLDPIDPELAEQKIADLAAKASGLGRWSRARRPKKAADVIAQVIAKRGYAARQGDERLREAWAEAAGEALARFSSPKGLRRGVLEVIVTSSVMRQELEFQKTTLMTRLTELLPDARIESLRFKVGRLE